MLNPLRRPKHLNLERTYPSSIETVWQTWTDPEMLQRWWGPDKTVVTDCEVDLRIGGTIHVVTQAGEAMGKYAGTRWPMRGTFVRIDEPTRLTYEAESWTEGEEAGTTIEHTNDIHLAGDQSSTTVRIEVSITAIGPKARMAAFGMKWGYKSHLDALGELLT